jgi:hypothetical protein
MPGVTQETAAKVDAEVGDAPITGLVAHVSGPSEAGWRIVDVWESEEDYQRFRAERLIPALQIATQGTPPPRRPFDVYAVNSIDGLGRRAPRP